MRNKVTWKVFVISAVLMMLASCEVPYVAVGNYPLNNTSDYSVDPFPPENISTNNMSFPLSSNTIYVPDNYTKIQWAVDNATDGDTIVVRDGIFTENVNVNKSHLTIKSENGSDSVVVQAANLDNHVFDVTMNYVNISGFTVKETAEHGIAGIYLCGAFYCNIYNNSLMNNWYGIILYNSNNNNLTNNNVPNKYYGIRLLSSNRNMISNNNASNNEYGIFLDNSSNNDISGNTVNSNSYQGISLDKSSNNNSIMSNIVNLNMYYGILLWDSNNNDLMNNTVNSNLAKGISLCSGSSYNTITDNNASNNYYGIYLDYSYRNTIMNNNASNNEYGYGICLYHSGRNEITNNNASNNYHGIYLSSYLGSHNTIMNNTVNSNNDHGIYLSGSYNNTIMSNNISNNKEGIFLSGTYNNTIISNTVNSNSRYGLCLYLSDTNNNNIYNNIFNNTNNTKVFHTVNNIWNTTKTLDENIIGGPYLGGNYWSDYAGEDLDGDGLGDSPYDISGDMDYLPLVVVIPVFDTNTGTYPSIMGNHTGTIKPSHDVIVNRMYTYPCAGTGGHSEYVKFENETWNITANWTGYKGDWHNITFDSSFTLEAGETYNYTIRTGSYPLIHHNTTLKVSDGEITCTQFTDANGKKHDAWIPAIRLE